MLNLLNCFELSRNETDILLQRGNDHGTDQEFKSLPVNLITDNHFFIVPGNS